MVIGFSARPVVMPPGGRPFLLVRESPMSDSYQQRHDAVSGLADLVQMLVGWLTDLAYKSALERDLKELEPVISRSLTADHLGALLFVKFYTNSGGVKLYHGVEFLATGTNPNTAYQTSRATGGIGKPAPINMLLDKQSCCMVWYRKRSVPVGPPHLGSKIIEWPDYEAIIKGKYAGN